MSLTSQLTGIASMAEYNPARLRGREPEDCNAIDDDGTRRKHPQNPLIFVTLKHLWMIHCYIAEKLPSTKGDIRNKLQEVTTSLETHSESDDGYVLIRKAAEILKSAIEPNVHHIPPEDATCDDIPRKILEYLCKNDLTKLDPVVKAYLDHNYSKPTQQCLEKYPKPGKTTKVDKVCDCQTQVKEHESQLKDLNAKLEKLTQLVVEYHRGDKKQKKKIQDLEEALEVQKAQNQDLEEALEVQKTRNQDLEETLEVQKTQNQDLKETLEVQKAQNQDLEEALEVQKTQNQDLEEALEVQETRNQDLEEALEVEKERRAVDGDLWYYVLLTGGGLVVGIVVGGVLGAYLGAKAGAATAGAMCVTAVIGSTLGASGGAAIGSIPYFMKQKSTQGEQSKKKRVKRE